MPPHLLLLETMGRYFSAYAWDPSVRFAATSLPASAGTGWGGFGECRPEARLQNSTSNSSISSGSAFAAAIHAAIGAQWAMVSQ